MSPGQDKSNFYLSCSQLTCPKYIVNKLALNFLLVRRTLGENICLSCLKLNLSRAPGQVIFYPWTGLTKYIVSWDTGDKHQVRWGRILSFFDFWIYSGTPFERPPWQEVTPSWKATWRCKSKHKCIDFYPWREATPSWKATWRCKSKHKCIDFYPWREAIPLERPLFWCKMGGLTWVACIYNLFYIFFLQKWKDHSRKKYISQIFRSHWQSFF